MSISKTNANSQATTANTAEQTALDTNFIAEADLVIASQIALGSFEATLTLTKGVSARNVMKYYQNLGYQVLSPSISGPGYGSNSENDYGFGEAFGVDDYNLDQPADQFGYAYDQFFNLAPTNLSICDGKTPAYLFLSWS